MTFSGYDLKECARILADAIRAHGESFEKAAKTIADSERTEKTTVPGPATVGRSWHEGFSPR
jgi:hypothetical protein